MKYLLPIFLMALSLVAQVVTTKDGSSVATGSTVDGATTLAKTDGSTVDGEPAGGGQSFSDTFTGTNGDPLSSDWTTLVGTWEIQSNQAAFTTGPWSSSEAYYDTTQTDGVDQYAKITLNEFNSSAWGGGVILRCNGTTYYYVAFYASSDSVYWSIGDDTNIQNSSTTVSDGDTWGVTIIGTGDDTVVRCWLNPTGDAPDSGGTTWGSASPTVSLTNNPGANARDAGKYVGIYGEGSSSNRAVDLDDFFGGDVP